MPMIEKMIQSCSGIGSNPYSVNVISFSGHGLNFDGDAIAVMPSISKVVNEIRFINLSGIARKFAAIPYSLNIFLCSMCRLKLSDAETKLIW